MKKSVLTFAIASTLAAGGFSTQVLADSPSFDFAQISKTKIDFDGGAEPDGFELKLNKSLTDSLYLNVDYTDVEEGAADLQLSNIGIGFKSDISDSSAFFAQLDYSKMDVTGASDESGYRASLGVRTKWTKNLEVKAAYEYLDFDDSESLLVVGGAYNISDNFAFTLDYKSESDFNQTSFGVRYDF